MPSSNFDGKEAIRIKFGDHGMTIETVMCKRIIHEDGHQVLVNRQEWFRMLPPMLTSPDGKDWFFGGVPCQLVPASKENLAGRARRNARRDGKDKLPSV